MSDSNLVLVQNVVEVVVKALVYLPDEVTVVTETSRHGQIVFLVDCQEDDRGKIIGRKGRTIEAIRKLLWAIGGRHQLDFDVELLRE